MQLRNKDILDIASLLPEEINFILDTAEKMKDISKRPIKKVPTLRGKTIFLVFFEPSTRTRLSFDVAAKRLSADVISMTASSSSVVKGESLLDTVKNLESMNPDIIVLRHFCSGAPHFISKRLSVPVINAGDGMHDHPSQSLLDLMTIRENKGSLKGLRITIIGDIAHSRVARADITGFIKMGAYVVVCGPPTMIPKGIEVLGCRVETDFSKAVKGADVIMVLRLQKERQKHFLLSSEREYNKVYGLSLKHIENADQDVLIMHPGPVNRGVEISNDAADSPFSIILDQVTNGVAVRMALFYLLAGGIKDDN